MPEPEPTAAPGWDADFRRALDSALRFLAYRPRSEAEVRRRMLRRYPLPLTELVMTTLRETHYLDDADFARHWRANRERHRPRSPEMIRQELGRFQVPREVIDEALEGFDAADNAYRAARKLATRLAGKEYPYFRQRLWAYLRRRGFGGPLIGQTVERLWQELADPLHGDKDAQDDEK